MVNNKIYVIHSNSKIESLYTLFPLIVSKFSHQVNFLNIDAKEAKLAEGKCVILVRVFKGNQLFAGEDQKKRDLINDFRKRFDRVIMLDDGAGSDSLHFEYMDLVDLYYKGKLLKERSDYTRPMYGRQLFTDYYNEKFGVIDDKIKIREIPKDPSLLNKLRVSWNLGCGIYPVPNGKLARLARAATTFNFSKALKPWYVYSYKKMIKKLGEPMDYDHKINKVQARFGNNSLPNTIGYQRKIYTQKSGKNENVITGSIKQKAYNIELKKVAAVLSPFGWGEICFRDFEAIINGSLLIKPDMSHLETWPDVYKNSKTYLPVDWDGNNLAEVINQASGNITEYADVIESARKAYKSALLEIDDKVLDFLEEATASTLN
jgi:hypothetical protein